MDSKYCRRILRPGVREYFHKVSLGCMWLLGYFVSGVGIDEETIKNYVEYRGQRDEGQLRKEL